MNAIVIEHVPLAELPLAWREKLGSRPDVRVTVRIEAEDEAARAQGTVAFSNDLLFGMWRDRDDMADVGRYVSDIRAPRFNKDGSRSDS
jgi:hypothetical protein